MVEHPTNDHLQRLLSQYGDDPLGMDSIMDQLNNLIQQGSKVQPAAWRSASDRVISELGNEIFSNLHPDSQHFLTTAKVLYPTSENVASGRTRPPLSSSTQRWWRPSCEIVFCLRWLADSKQKDSKVH